MSLGLVVAGSSGLLPLPSRAETAPPSVIFLLDNHESMQDFPEWLPEVNWDSGAVPDPDAIPDGAIGARGPAGLAVGTGCEDPALVDAMKWFNKDSTDPTLNGSIPYDNDADFGSTPQFFDPNVFYQSRGRRIAWQVEENPSSLTWAFKGMHGTSDAASACFNSMRWNSAYWDSPVYKQCLACLTSKGWWRGPIVEDFNDGPRREPDEPPLPREAYRKWVVSGRVLNVRPPRFVVARKVLKDVIATESNVRMGVATFGPDRGWYDPPLMLQKLRPSCDLSYPTINEAALDRPTLMRAVNRTEFRNNERSIGEALFGLGAYFSSQKVDNRWTSWFQQPLNPGWGWPGCCDGGTYNDPYTGREGQYWGIASDEWLKSDQPWEESTYPYGLRSVCFGCQVSSVIVLTGGAPKYDNTVPITKMMEILKDNGARHPDGTPLTFDSSSPETNTNPGGVNYCDKFGVTKEACDYTEYNWPTGLAKTNRNFMDDAAFFLANTDLRDDMPGQQSVRTFVVGYGDSSPMLQSIALAGKGRFYRADQPATLKEAVTFALGEVRAPSCPAPW